MSALTHAIRILSCFSEAEPELRLSDISRRLALSKSHTHRLLAMLVEEGLLKREPRSGKYQLGLRLFQMGRLAASAFDPAPAWPAMKELARVTSETVLLGVQDDFEVVSIQQILSPRILRVAPSPLWRAPLTQTITGHAILAWLPDAEMRRVMRHAAMGPAEADRLEELLSEIRQRGYAASEAPSASDIRAVSAPLHDGSGAILGALTVAAPAQRLAPRQIPRLAQLVVQTAEQLSGQSGRGALVERVN